MSAPRPLRVRERSGDPWLTAWVVVLAVLALGPTLVPGYVLSYDMVWVPHLDVSRADVWGLGSGLPRAVPSDGVVALLGVVLPQQVVQKALLLTALVGAGLGGVALTRDLGRAARWGAATFMVWNPFVAERLGLGHWPLLLAYAATPWLVIAVRGRRFGPATLLLAATALTPLSGVMGAVVALVVGRGRDAWRWLLLAGAVNAPWIVAALVSPAGLASDSAGVDAFASNGGATTPAWLEVMGLGGTWNADVRPLSRDTVVALVLTVVFALGVAWGLVIAFGRARREVGPLLALWGIGFVVALAGVLAPGALGSLVETVPGAGLLRDGSRWVVLMVPAAVVGFATCVDAIARRPAVEVVAWMIALAFPIMFVPDLAWGLGGRLHAVDYPRSWNQTARSLAEQDGPGDLLSLPFSPFRAPAWNHGRPVLDPAGRYFDRVTVTSDVLTVGDVEVAGEDPRAARVGEALTADDWSAIAREGIGWVVLDTAAADDTAFGQVSDLSLVAEHGDLRLYRVPGVVDPGTPVARLVAVVLGWLTAAVALLAAVVTQIGSRRKTARGR